MRKEQDFALGTKNFRLKQLSGSRGLSLLIILTKMSEGIFGAINKENLLDTDLEKLANSIFKKLDEKETVNLVKTVIEESIIIPKDFNFDLDVAGDYDDLFYLFYEILKLNYEKSFLRLKKKVSELGSSQLATLQAQQKS
jgi:hypothetical protein